VDPVLRGHGLGRLVVGFALREAQGRVYALALEPGFFGRLGFLRLPEPPEPLREKAEGLCASSGFVPMLLSPSLVPRAGGDASS
jgi:N-acetylglutamate synthase-like GNAT family acetyltransferase